MRLWFRFRALFRKEKLDAEMAEEMRVHLELQTAANVARGLTPDEARDAAQRSFCRMEQIKECCRDQRGWIWPEQTSQDVRFAVRQLARAKGFTVVVALTLALGIGGATAIFSVVHAVLLRGLPFAEPQQLVWVAATLRNQTDDAALSPADFFDYREQSRSFSHLAASISDSVPMNLTGGGEPERLLGAEVTANFLDVFGVRPYLGRAFSSDEGEFGNSRVVVLSHGLWTRRFGGDSTIIGRTITLNGADATVIGVMPPRFQFPAGVELWKPLSIDSSPKSPMKSRDLHMLRTIGRLKPGVALAQAQAELGTIARGLAVSYPRSNADWGLKLTPLQEHVVGNTRPTLLVLFAAVAGVLLIACANVANLLLARGAVRQKEIAVRAALGAGRNRILRQLLTENLALALLGGIGGVLLARWGVGLLVASGGADLPRVDEIAINFPVLGFALLVALLTGMFFGLVPAAQLLRVDLTVALGDSGRGTGGGVRRQRALRILVIGEVALATVLLLGAGLLVRSFVQLQQVDRGFDDKNLLTIRVDLVNPSASTAKRAAFFEQLERRVVNLPGVEAVGMISELPLSRQGAGILFKVEGRVSEFNKSDGAADLRRVNDDYFHAMRIPLLRGRAFTAADVLSDAKVAVISDALARRFFPLENPIGRRLRVEVLGNATFEIVGVVGDVRHRSLAADAWPALYHPSIRAGWTNLVIRTVTNPGGLATAVRREVAALDPNQPVANIRTMEQWTAASLAQPRLRTWLVALFSTVALVIALVGIYGVMAYFVTQRTRELGIRMALGASGLEIVRMVMRQGLWLALAGLTVGLLAALALTRLMQDLLFGVRATDPFTFAATALMFLAAALAACWLPAFRAAKVDPMMALRCE